MKDIKSVSQHRSDAQAFYIEMAKGIIYKMRADNQNEAKNWLLCLKKLLNISQIEPKTLLVNNAPDLFADYFDTKASIKPTLP